MLETDVNGLVPITVATETFQTVSELRRVVNDIMNTMIEVGQVFAVQTFTSQDSYLCTNSQQIIMIITERDRSVEHFALCFWYINNDEDITRRGESQNLRKRTPGPTPRRLHLLLTR